MTSEQPHLQHLAQLSNLLLKPEELSSLSKDFKAIVEFVDTLRTAKTEEIPATNQVTELENVVRSDAVVHFVHHRALLEHVPHRHGDLFRVPGVFDRNNSPDVS